jgi:hypothetical protein
MFGIGEIDRELVCLDQFRAVFELCVFRYEREIARELAASAKISRRDDAL